MHSVKFNIPLFCLLLIFCLIFPLKVHASVFQIPDEDSVMVKELLMMDTLQLKIHGASNDLAFYMNGIVFLSNSKYHQKMIPDHITFGQDQTYFVPLEYISLESSRPLFENDPFPYPPGGMSFTRDYRKVYFTKPIELSGRRTVEKIYEMSIIDSRGSSHTQLPFCSDPSRYMHPAISNDGSLMIFASDRMPSNGGLDLFLVRKLDDGWSTPVNLGRAINTSGHEWYPFLDHRNNLYFSSSGHMGYGGYDVYLCLYDGSGWGEPMNMSEFINSEKDELAFSIHPNNRLAVFSTSFGYDPSHAQVYRISLNAGAMVLAGIEDSRNSDMALLFQDLVKSGYTQTLLAAGEEEPGEPPAEEPETGPEQPAAEEEPELLVAEEEQVTEKPPEEAAEEPELLVAEEEPATEELPEEAAEEPELLVAEEEPPEEELVAEEEPVAAEAGPDQVIFRVQFLSSTRPNTMSSVTLGGEKYDTWEYLYKGAYRITVGASTDLQDALDLRAKCREAGYNQAFVAAFRNNQRELDPSVFRR